MSIGAISMQNVNEYNNTENRSDSVSEAERLEKRKERLKEQLQCIEQNNMSSESDMTRQENIKILIDNIDKKIMSMPQHGNENVSSTNEASKTRTFSVDKYISNNESSTKNTAGIYSLEKDESGNLKIVFGNLEESASGVTASVAKAKQADESKEKDNTGVSPANQDDKSEKAPGSSPSDKSGVKCTVNTDKVDEEISNLKKEKQQIEQELKRATEDDTNKEGLEKRMEAIETELRLKDNDSYRRQNAEYTTSIN